jgi:acyl-CoA thioester hydrolase
VKHVHTLRIPIRWGDMDAMGHVNNTVYFQYIETARVAWLDAIGGAPCPDGTGPVVVHAHCSFLKQLTYPGTIEVRTLVGPPGRSSFEMSHELRMVQADGSVDATLHATGGAKLVWADMRVQKSVPLPDCVRTELPPPA